jgi:hypothetical protein
MVIVLQEPDSWTDAPSSQHSPVRLFLGSLMLSVTEENYTKSTSDVSVHSDGIAM